ncbi:basic secretory protein-like protein [Actinoalloteichus fjordicus]|uniref:Peptidase MA superfamily n=1 Tax=Actinoalloteichus fjordicus TaxID=1612552 RepID=A0AAC9LIJ6_9PSEU|nr:Peptidase MA superfamily [Actinoalloteichus fjordicus]APU23070.1 Peptidase MA superfamily [Actinoalloteichus sp. GBA129-24]
MSRSRSWAAAAITAVLVTALALITLPRADRLDDHRLDGRAEAASVTASPPPLPFRSRSMTGEPSGSAADAANLTADDEAVARLLDRRARAVLDRDEQAFLATVDPAADPEFRRSEREMFANLADVPLAEWSYRLVRPAALMPPPPAVRSGPDAVAAPEVELRYALAGVDEESTGKPMAFLFVRRGAQWYVNSDTGLESQGRRTWRGPWSYGPCLVLRVRSGLVLGHPENAALTRRVADELDDAVRSVSEVWGTDWSRQAAVLLPASSEEFHAQAGHVFSLEDIAALAVADTVDTATGRATGQRVVVNPTSAARLSDTALRVVLRHEVTHVAARGQTAPGAPMWLLEGFADYVGYRDSGLSPRQIAPDLHELISGSPAADVEGSAPGTGQPPPTPPLAVPALPADGEFHEGGRRLDLAYQTSWSLLDFLATRYGETRVVNLYRRLAIQGEWAEDDVDRVLRSEFGLGRTALLADWRSMLADEFG